MSQIAQDLSLPPPPMRLRPKVQPTILFLLISIAVAIGGWKAWDSGYGKGMVLGFGGVTCVIFCIMQLLPVSSQLDLTEEGFAYTHLFERTTVRWTDVKESA